MSSEPMLQQPIQPTAPQSIPTIQQAPLEKKPRTMIIFIILLVVLVACVASIGGFWVARQIPIANTPTPTVTSFESPPQDPTANWKIYTNSKYTFKYPTNWTLNDLTGGQQVETYFQPDKTKSVGAILVEKLNRAPGNISQYNIKKQIGNMTADCLFDSSGFKTWCYLSNSMLSFLITKDQSTTYNEILDNILSTFKFIEDIPPSNPPTGWTAKNDLTCNVSLPIPPTEVDIDNRTWQVGTNPNYDFMGFFRGKGVYVIHRNPTEAGGFVSGLVDVGCGLNTNNSSLDKLYADFHAHLTLQTPQNTIPEALIELTSNKDIMLWGIPAKEMTFVGGMFDPKQKYYLLINSGKWYLITQKSNSTYAAISQQTNQIFNLLQFTN